MIVDDAAEIHAIVSRENAYPGVVKGVKRAKVDTLINRAPNPYQDINTFRRNLVTDFVLDGNIFIYYDGAHLYHLPASKVKIHADEFTYIEKYSLNDTDFLPSEIIHIKENSFYSIYRGVSRLSPALRTMNLITSMRKFQDNFFARNRDETHEPRREEPDPRQAHVPGAKEADADGNIRGDEGEARACQGGAHAARD